MALLNLGGGKKRRKSKKLKTPKKGASLKAKQAYVEKMSKRIAISETTKKVDAMIAKIKNYSFA